MDQYKDTEYYKALIDMRDKYKELGQEGLPAEDIGALVSNILTNDKPKTRYAILRNKLMMWTLPRIMPKRVVDKIIADRFGFPKQASS